MKKLLVIALMVCLATTTCFLSISNSVKAGDYTVEVKVSYSGSWSGCYGDAGSSTSVDGYGTRSFYLQSPDIVSAVFQKMDEGHGTLTVEIIKDGTVVERGSTNAQYGVVSVSHSFMSYTSLDYDYGWDWSICLTGVFIGLIIIGFIIYFLTVAAKSKTPTRQQIYQPKEIMSEGGLYCNACGFGNKEGSNFCRKCGARLV